MPDEKNIEKIASTLKDFKGQYKIIDKAVSYRNCVFRFQSEGSTDSKICDDGSVEISCVKIDEYVGDLDVTFLKIDIEGYELNALKGAKETIVRCKPTIAISLYHKPEDIFVLPEYILSLNPEYKLFVRRYDALCAETVLFAV